MYRFFHVTNIAFSMDWCSPVLSFHVHNMWRNRSLRDVHYGLQKLYWIKEEDGSEHT